MEIVLGACCGGLLPGVFLALLVYTLDRYEKEPWGLVGMAFLWGAVPAIILSLLVQLPVDWLFPNDLVTGVIVAPISEEFFKALIVGIFVLAVRREVDSVTDGIVYGAMAGFGFGATENVLYLLGAGAEGGAGQLFIVWVLRTIVFGLNHAFFTSLTGIGLAKARLSRSTFTRVVAPLLGLAAAILAHGVHNLGVGMTEQWGLGAFGLSILSDWMGALGVLVTMLVALNNERKWMLAYLPEEVGLGVLSQAQYENALSTARRTAAVFGALARGDLTRFRQGGRFFGLCSELAQKKHQCITLGEQHQAEVTRLRNELYALGQTLGAP